MTDAIVPLTRRPAWGGSVRRAVIPGGNDGRSPVRRLGVLRRDRRPGLQEDLPRAAGDGQARPPRRAGHRRGQGRLGPRPASRRGRATASNSTAASIRGGVRQAVRPAPLRRRRLQGPGDLPGPPQGARRRPASGALPGHPARCCSGWSWSSSAKSGCARAPASSSRSRSAATWTRRRRSTRSCSSNFDETAIFRIDHYLGKTAGAEPALLPLRQLVPGADLEPPARRERADHDGGELRRPGPRRLLRRDRRDPRRGPEPPVPGPGQPGDGAPGRARTASPSATRR